jgi:hypothetical protein
MILRWTVPDSAQHYLDGLTHVALLGIYGHPDDSAAEDAVPLPDYAAIHEAETRVWSVPGDRAHSPGRVGVRAYVLTDGRDGHLIERVDCVWMAALNDRGDTIDQLVRTRPKPSQATNS